MSYRFSGRLYFKKIKSNWERYTTQTSALKHTCTRMLRHSHVSVQTHIYAPALYTMKEATNPWEPRKKLNTYYQWRNQSENATELVFTAQAILEKSKLERAQKHQWQWGSQPCGRSKQRGISGKGNTLCDITLMSECQRYFLSPLTPRVNSPSLGGALGNLS